MGKKTATATAQKYAFDGGNGSGFVDDAENENANVNVPQSLSPSGIRFSFGDAARTGSNMPAMSPIPFTRNLGKGDASEVADQSAWNRFIPTPLINQKQKTKSYRK